MRPVLAPLAHADPHPRALKAVEEHKATLKNHPNPPAPNITHF